MSSSAIRRKARQTLKHLEGKYKLFLVPILLTWLSGGLTAYTRYTFYSENTTTSYQYPMAVSMPHSTAFPQLLNILTALFLLSAAYTMLEVIRQKRPTVDYNDLARTFNSTYLLNLFLLFIARTLLLLPWTILVIFGAITTGVSLVFVDNSGTGMLVMTAIGIIAALVGIVFLIIKSYAYSQTDMILFDRIEDGQQVDPFDIIKESKELMAGHKFDLFILQLSFIGWHLLNLLTLGLLTLYVLPYTTTATVVFYDNLSNKHNSTDR